MCEPISIGIAIGAAVGAATSAATGGNVLQGALMGGLMGGVTGGMGGLGAGSTTSGIGSLFGASTSTSFINAVGSSVTQAGVAGLVATTAAGGLLTSMLSPKTPDYSQQSPQVQYANQFNSQNIATTGSGGRQAAGSLAEAIKRTKDRKLTQRDVGDLSIDTGSFAPTGLQFA